MCLRTGKRNRFRNISRVTVEGREHLDVWQARLGQEIIVERVGGTTGSPMSHGMLRAVREIGPTLVAGQAGTETATDAYETWSILDVGM